MLLTVEGYSAYTPQKIANARKLAEQGGVAAQFALGVAYYYGDMGVRKDYSEAFKWLKLAAEQGDLDSQYIIGHMYANGEGVGQNYGLAIWWYNQAAFEGHGDAQAELRQFAEKGYSLAQYSIGRIYIFRNEPAEAFRWYKLAAEQGFALAQINIGGLCETGRGVRQNYSEAMKWYKLAATQGNALAQVSIGYMYQEGKSVKQNKRIAKEWFGKACDNGEQFGCDAYRKLNEQGY